MLNIKQLFIDFNIPIAENENKHFTEGWINTHCPFCEGSQNFHLGFNINQQFFTCYRCGWKSISDVISKLLNVTRKQANLITTQYTNLLSFNKKKEEVKLNTQSFQLPSNSLPLQENHKKYLENRNFDPDFLVKEWGLLGTGPVSKISIVDKVIDYKHRIIIPFFWKGKLISFDSRDITGKAINKYMACPGECELISHKDILYGKQEKWKETGICVEGPTDVWRFGVNSFAVSGIKFKRSQVQLIASLFKRVAVIFDGEIGAKKQAMTLISELKFRKVDAFFVAIENDPGLMDQKEANYLIKQIIK